MAKLTKRETMLINNYAKHFNVNNSAKISKEHVSEAINIVFNCKLNNEDDCFLIFSAFNLLNAYAKQAGNSKEFVINEIAKHTDHKSKKPLYFFKWHVWKRACEIVDKNFENVKAYPNIGCSVVECLGVQFSFHNTYTSDNESKNKYLVPEHYWSGIRLQPVALQLYLCAKTIDISDENKVLITSPVNKTIDEIIGTKFESYLTSDIATDVTEHIKNKKIKQILDKKPISKYQQKQLDKENEIDNDDDLPPVK